MRENLFRKYVVIVLASLLLAILACNAPAGGSDITPTVPGGQETAVPGAPAPSTGGEAPAAAATAAPATPSATPTLTATPTTPCNYDSVYVADVSIPDGTEIVTGGGFTKTWRIQNNGCLPWPSGTVLLFVEGHQMGGPTSVPVPATAAGGTQDISVPLVAPATPGEYKGYWRLRSADGIQFGDKIYVSIKSVPPTPTPTTVPVCGNGVIETGEECDTADTCSGISICGSNCQCRSPLVPITIVPPIKITLKPPITQP